MKKVILLLSIVCLSAISIQALAGPITLAKAKSFLKETNKLVIKAKDEIKIHKVYNGHFTKAVLYQREAKKMYLEQKYKKAVELSFIARFHANKTINTNTGGAKLFLSTLSENERKIVIDDTSAGFWHPSKSGTEELNITFVNNAIRDRIPFDYIKANINRDKELSNKPLNIAID